MTDGSRTSLPRWIVRRWPLKLLSIVLAYGTWLAVTTDIRVIQDYNVPVDVNVNDDVILTGERVNRVTLRLRGTAGQFRRIDPLRLAVRLDLRDAALGERTEQIEPGDLLGVPPGVEVTMIEPRVLSFSIARRVKAELPVRPRLEGQLPDGVELYGTSVTPARVEVEGPESAVAGLDHVATDPISLSGRSESFTVGVAAAPVEPDVRVLVRRLLTVSVVLDERATRRTFGDVEVRALAASGRTARVSPPTITITLSGPPRLLERLQPDQVRLTVDATGLEPGARGQKLAPTLELLDLGPREREKIRLAVPASPSVTVRVTESGSGP